MGCRRGEILRENKGVFLKQIKKMKHWESAKLLNVKDEHGIK